VCYFVAYMGTRSKTYLLTGAAGFIGSRFAESCALRGIELLSVDLKSHFQSRTEHAQVLFGQTIDRDSLISFLDKSAPKVDAIIHLGACTNTFELDADFFKRVNFEYTKALWNFATQSGLPFVYASSGATYGAGELGYDDDEKLIPSLKPLNPYGQSKQDFDLWALNEEKNGNHPTSWAGFKFFNVYGFGERHKSRMASVVLHSFDQIQKTGGVKLFRSHRTEISDGHQMRDFIAVEDVIDVLHFAAGKPINRGIFNLGSGRARTFLDLARATFAALKLPEKIEFVDTPEVLRERYQYFTEAKMQKLKLEGYTKPFRPLEEGVKIYVSRLIQS